MADRFAPAFLSAVVDTLLPGDAALPSGTSAGVVLRADATPNAAGLGAISLQAGGADAFVAASAAQRVSILAAVETQNVPAFRALLMPLLQDYYESNPVMEALGWRPGPPQPLGYDVVPTDDETWRRLDAVRRRGAMWRKVS